MYSELEYKLPDSLTSHIVKMQQSYMCISISGSNFISSIIHVFCRENICICFKISQHTCIRKVKKKHAIISSRFTGYQRNYWELCSQALGRSEGGFSGLAAFFEHWQYIDYYRIAQSDGHFYENVYGFSHESVQPVFGYTERIIGHSQRGSRRLAVCSVREASQ